MRSSVWSHPVVLRLAHASPALWLVSALAVAWAPEWVLWMVFVALTGASAAQLSHGIRLCPRCAAKTPLNGQRAVRRVRPLLWLYHHLWAAIVPVGVSLAWRAFDSVNTIVIVTCYIGFAATTQAILVHRVCRPWCPWCTRWDRVKRGRTRAPA